MADEEEKPEPLGVQVFRVIAAHYEGRADHIARFVAARYSFEEWLNWEAFAACSNVSEWEARPKPSYSSIGVEGCKDYGDLLITSSAEQVLVEIGLVHDGTGDKWRAKLDWDAEKLARPISSVSPLHIIVLASASEIETSEAWRRWLAKVKCWICPTNLTASAALSPKGAMVIRGWTR